MQPYCAMTQRKKPKKMTHIEMTRFVSGFGIFSTQERSSSYAKYYSNQFLDDSCIVMGRLSHFMKMNQLLLIVNGKGSVCRPHLFTYERTKIVLYSLHTFFFFSIKISKHHLYTTKVGSSPKKWRLIWRGCALKPNA